MSVQKVDTLEDFKKALAENKRVAVDFYADWCGPCRMISPKFAKFAETYKDIKFFKVNVDDNDETAGAYKVSAMPTFVFFFDNKKVDELVGASESGLEEKLKKLAGLS